MFLRWIKGCKKKNQLDKPSKIILFTNKKLETEFRKEKEKINKKYIVGIDPGHGGEDPGAVGPEIQGRNLHEKQVVLAMAKYLQAMLTAEPGFAPVLIRKGDYYVKLRKRTSKARQLKADVFISLHADAFRTTEPRGASVWTLSQRGATSEMGRWLARNENDADLIGGVSLDDKELNL